MSSIQNRILDASIEIIQKEGLQGLTLQNITSRCHISRSTFYKHFESKEDLLDVIRSSDETLDIRSTREKILLAAIKEFSQTSYTDIDLETIAEAVHMKRSSIYRYFPTKEKLFEESLKMELESRREYFKSQNIVSQDFAKALNIFFDYLTVFRKNDYKNLIFFQALSCAQYNENIRQALKELWQDTAEILLQVLVHGKKSGVLRQDFSEQEYAQILLSYLGGSSIFSFDNYDILKNTFIELICHKLMAPKDDKG